MNTFRRRFLIMVLSLWLSACAGRSPVLPTPATLPPLPTPVVPPRTTIQAAIQRWEASQTTRYVVEVEESTGQGKRRIRLVVADGDIRAAQVLSYQDGQWSAPQALPLEQAASYTVDALLQRVLRDATGQGAVPYDMLVVFDPGLGFPAVVQANATATYTADGQLQLNREYSYRLGVSVRALMEDTYGVGREPVLTLRQSGGAQAWCDALFLYADGSSMYVDDCVQTLLQFQLPPRERDALEKLLSDWAPIESERVQDGGLQQLKIAAQGTQPADDAALADIWEQVTRWYQMLSRPIGAGRTLLFAQGNQVIGMELHNFLAQPTTIRPKGALYGALLSPDATGIAFADENGLRWFDLNSGNVSLWLAAGGAQFYPLAWSASGRLLLGRQDEGGATLGWVVPGAEAWHPLPLPEGYAGCVNGWDWSPDGRRLVLSVLPTNEACKDAPLLAVVEVDEGRFEALSLGPTLVGVRTPRWSPDGQWLYLGAVQDAQTIALVRVHPDGSDWTVVAAEEQTRFVAPLWDRQGHLLYARQGGAESGIWQCTPDCQLLIAGEDLTPLSLSPDGDFLLYRSGDALKVWVMAFGEGVPVTRGRAQWVGWLTPTGP